MPWDSISLSVLFGHFLLVRESNINLNTFGPLPVRSPSSLARPLFRWNLFLSSQILVQDPSCVDIALLLRAVPCSEQHGDANEKKPDRIELWPEDYRGNKETHQQIPRERVRRLEVGEPRVSFVHYGSSRMMKEFIVRGIPFSNLRCKEVLRLVGIVHPDFPGSVSVQQSIRRLSAPGPVENLFRPTGKNAIEEPDYVRKRRSRNCRDSVEADVLRIEERYIEQQTRDEVGEDVVDGEVHLTFLSASCSVPQSASAFSA